VARVESYRDLIVWQKSMDLAAQVYALTASFPKSEEYRLTSQMTRAAVSIPANIAEGSMRGSRKDYARFVAVARGSAAELSTFLMLAVRIQVGVESDIKSALLLCEEIGRMLTALHGRLKTSSKT
jgi:four helix bundle protein